MPSTPLHYTGTNGQFSIEGFTSGWLSMHGPAWNLLDAGPLALRGPTRGEDPLIPGVPGLLDVDHLETEASFSLPFVVTGDFDPAGIRVAFGDRVAQLETTVEYLEAQIIGRHPAKLEKENGTTLTGDVKVHGLTWIQNLGNGSNRAYTLDLDIPAGHLS